MLILTRRCGEYIAIGPDIRVWVIEIEGKQVRLGTEAPESVTIHRSEIAEKTDMQPEFEPPVFAAARGNSDANSDYARFKNLSSLIESVIRNNRVAIPSWRDAMRFKEDIDRYLMQHGDGK